MKKDRNRIYTNGEITIYWQAVECIHATTCFVELRSVFDPQRRPWIDPKGGTTEEILDIIEKCPTMALSFRWNDPARNETEKSSKLFKGKEEDHFERRATPERSLVNVRPDGPIVVTGNFTLEKEDGSIKTLKMTSLCRCGRSKNLPHCDGTHFTAGFKEPAE